MVKISVCKIRLDISTIIEIGKFSILWGLFEDKKCENNCKVDILKRLVYGKLTNENWKKLANTFVERIGIRNCNSDEYVEEKLSLGRGLSRSQKSYVKRFLSSNGQESLEGGLIAIYRIRNNLCHGLKNLENIEEQRNLFKGINKFLTYAIKEL